MDLSTLKAELYKNAIAVRRNYFRLFDISVWPLILFFAITLFLKFVSPTVDIISMAITGLIGWRAVYHFQIESNISYMEDYWARNTAHQLASPLGIWQVVLSGIIAGFFKFLIVLAMYLVLAKTIFGFTIVDVFKFVVGVSYLAFTGAIIGILTFCIVILYREKAITFAFMVPDLFVLLSGVYYPITIFPPLMVKFVHILPTFYGFELLKSMVGLGTANYTGMIVVSAIWLFFALWLLSLAVKRARKNGSFCRWE